MNGAFQEENKVIQAVISQSLGTAVDMYNGANLAGSTTNGIDTLGFEEATALVNGGAIGSDGLTVTLMASADANAANATTILDSAGTACSKALVDADDGKAVILRARMADEKRYLFVKTRAAGATANVFGVQVVLSKAKVLPVTQPATTLVGAEGK